MADTATALISAGVSAVVSATVSYLSRRSSERTAIDGKVLKSIELAMSYPHVEDEEYCKEWGKPLPPAPSPGAPPEDVAQYEAARDKRLQYDMYCCFIFNMLESIWEHCWTKSGISKLLHVEEFIETHRCWWESQKQNLFGYDKGFQLYVQSIINDIKRREAKP